jgi:hypothetical protein
MLPPNLNKWTIHKKTENILFFAQLIEEMLFNFSLEHFKVPPLNTHTLSEEMLRVIEQIESGRLAADSLPPIVDELKAKIDGDPALEALLKNKKAAVIHELEADVAPENLINSVQALNSLLKDAYLQTTITLLREQMVHGDKGKIIALTKNFLTELIYRGYSPENIFFENKNHFFEGSIPKRIEDLSAFDGFLSLFPLKIKKWTVVFRTGKDFKHLHKFPSHLKVSATTEKPDMRFPQKPENIGIFLDRKFILPNYLTFQDVAAFDGFSARYAMEEKLLLLDCLAKYHIHRAELEWSRAALVFDADKTNVGVFGKPAPAILKRPDQSPRQFSNFISDTAAAIFSEKLDEDSSLRLFRALQTHDIAIRVPAPENQLRELWSVLDLLFTSGADEKEKISRLTARLVPYLIIGFPAKLAADLIKSIRNSGSKEALDILYSIEHGHNLIEKCLLLVFTDENRENRDKLHRCLGNHLLLIQRIDYLSRIFSSADSIHATLDAYSRKIAWQIQRVFRAIELLGQTGQNVSVVNKLVESFHSITDRAMNVLMDEISRKKDQTTIEKIHEEIRMQSRRHFEILEKRQGELCSRDNFNCLLFGDESPVQIDIDG